MSWGSLYSLSLSLSLPLSAITIIRVIHDKRRQACVLLNTREHNRCAKYLGTVDWRARESAGQTDLIWGVRAVGADEGATVECSGAGQALAGRWQGTGPAVVWYWSGTGPVLVRYWSGTGRGRFRIDSITVRGCENYSLP